MKKFTKLLGIVLIIALVMSMGIMAFADGETTTDTVTISVTRDNTYDSSASGDRTYTYYQVFRATYNGTHTDATTGDHGYDNNGDAQTPLTSSGTATGFSYYLLSTDTAAVNAIKGTGNQWFDYVDSADGSRTTVSWKTSVAQTAENLQAAAEWLKANCVLATGPLDHTAGTTTWSKTVDKGYYVIEGSEGKNLVAATTNIDIKEKNSYPTIKKEQADEDKTTMSDATRNVAVGDVIDYQVTVKVPADANKPIVVTDTMTAGLTYDSETGLSFNPTLTANTDYVVVTADYAITVDGAEVKPYDSNAAWQISILPTTATLGKEIVISFKATVDPDALVTDVTQKNTVELKYDNTHYVMTDEVDYDVWASGIVKYDGDTATESAGVLTAKEGKSIKYLEGVTFKLQEKGAGAEAKWADVAVIKDGAYYRPLDTTAATAETPATITTDANGQIIFRGLDGDKSYQLVELTTLDGYNLMTGPAALTLTKEAKDATAASIDAGSDEHTTYLTAASVTKVPNNSGTVLPSTGGIGTTIFYVVGSILVVAAGVLLITKKRMSREG